LPINDAFKHQVKSANPIESVVANYATLKRSGRNYVCCCPFHSEKTPSFHINVGEGFYKCFGCGESGDVFSFVMKVENLDFVESLRFLADRAGIPMPRWERTPSDERNSRERQRLLELNREARVFFYRQLRDSRQVLNYIKYTRRLSADTALKVYTLGYAPNGWCELTNHLRGAGYSDEDIVKAGLAKTNQRGVLVDFFRNRLMVPILDGRGNTVAFGGRIVEDGIPAPKYLNSPDTPVFKKSEHLFSLNLAKKSIDSKHRTLLLAEGYMDVIALYQHGFHNAVASLGTSLTPEQVSTVKRYADEVILCYDSDDAGVNATNRAIALLLNGSDGKELKIRVLRMSGAKDPDEYVREYGTKEFQRLLDEATDAIDFQLEQVRSRLNLNTNSGKVELLKHSANILAQISDPSTRGVYVSSIARECNVEPSTFSLAVDGAVSNASAVAVRPTVRNAHSSYVPTPVRSYPPLAGSSNAPSTLGTINSYDDRADATVYEAERWTIAYLCTLSELIPDAKEALSYEDFRFDVHRNVFKALCEHAEAISSLDDLSVVHGDLSEEHFQALLHIRDQYGEMVTRDVGIEQARKGLQDCVKRLKEPRVSTVDGKVDLLQLKNKKLQEERLKHKNFT
jgi:DNA primase